MTFKQVDYLNIGLMLLSAGIAFIIPFHLFLFSYAVLGPLHYLTEISWLHKRQYFTKGKFDFILLVALCFVGLLGSFFNDILVFLHLSVPQFLVTLESTLQNNYISTHAIFIAFISAMIMIFIKDYVVKILAILFVVFVAFLVHGTIDVNNTRSLLTYPSYLLYFGIFLPTIIHVYFFTGAFILSGALKNRSKTGLMSLVVFATCTISFFLIPAFSSIGLSDTTMATYKSSNFETVNASIMKVLSAESLRQHAAIYTSNIGIMVMRFIAFAYTYHYLNWFSKTSVIKWHKVPKLNLAVVLIIWLLSLAAYGYNYSVGLMWLYFLSMLHVFLEFPLNFQSFKLIVQDFRSWAFAGAK